MKILIADDDISFINMFIKVLNELASGLVEIDTATSIIECYQKINRDGYDKIFIDYKFRNLSATDLFDLLYINPEKIYVLSAYEKEFLEKEMAPFKEKIVRIISKVEMSKNIEKFVKDVILKEAHG